MPNRLGTKRRKKMNKCKLMYHFDPANELGDKSRRELIQRIIDGQASDEEQKWFDDSVTDCANCECKSYCIQVSALKDIIRENVEKKKAPADLLDAIKKKIKS